MLASLEFAKTQSFETDCCGDGMPLPPQSEEEIQAQETAHAIIVNFTRSLNVVCMWVASSIYMMLCIDGVADQTHNCYL